VFFQVAAPVGVCRPHGWMVAHPHVMVDAASAPRVGITAKANAQKCRLRIPPYLGEKTLGVR